MNGPMETLEAGVEALRTAWAGALSTCDSPRADGVRSASVEAHVRSMSDAGLLRATDAAGGLRRSMDALLATLAGEVARRSPQDAGAESLAKKQGYRGPAQLVADATGGAFAGAAKLVAVGKVTADRTSLTGEALPPKHPHVADALRSGSVSVDAAAAIASMLDRIGPRVDLADADRFEQLLAKRAAGLPLDLLNRAIADVEARLDPDGVQPREEELRASRALTVRQDSHGMVRITGALDPESGAPVLAALQGIVTHALRAARDAGEGGRGPASHGGDGAVGAEAGAVVSEGRSIPQLQADALSMICRHAIGCNRLPDAPAASVVVRLDLKSLTEATGHAQIDGITQPVSASTARRMAATAGIIPIVLDGDSLPLDVGRAARGFSRAQRIALAERDGGCASCGLDIPYTEAHHIRWWTRDKGRTDLSNGVLLCQACHTRVHTDGWTITADRNRVWFTPPAFVDPDRVPRPGGKARYRVTDRPPGGAHQPDPRTSPSAASPSPTRPATSGPPRRDGAAAPAPGTASMPRGSGRRSTVEFRA